MSRWPTRDAERVIHRAWHVILTRGWFWPEEVSYLADEVERLLSREMASQLPLEHTASLRGLLARLEQAVEIHEEEEMSE